MVFNPAGIRNFILTFGIGGIAAIAPFLFMQMLPALLNPGLHMDPPNYTAIIMTGCLVGIITAIIFAAQFEKREPQDIFFYALGIPAILIATVSNLGTEYKAMSRISDVKDTLTAEVLNPSQPETLSETPTPLTPPPGQQQGMVFNNRAWALEKGGDRPILLAQAHGYLVAIGEYNRAKEAWDDYKKYKDKKLRTERYARKELEVFEIRKGSYVLVYGKYSSSSEANKVYQLLRINDPGLNVRILKY